MQNILETSSAFQLKGSLLTMTVLQLTDADINKFNQQLQGLVEKAPKLFQNAPVLVDIQALQPSDTPINFMAISQALKQKGLIPVGIRGGSELQQQVAIDAGLALFARGKAENSDIDLMAKPKIKKTSVQEQSNRKSKLIETPVRSGQQIYAKNCDLIVLSSVSRGAEILADGNIHCYGPMRGRALAGIQGDSETRIFCQSIDAELVSIAGRYMTNENAPQLCQNVPQQIYLRREKLIIDAL